MKPRHALLFLLVCSLIGLAVPLWLGMNYTDRLAERASAYLVPVADHVTPPIHKLAESLPTAAAGLPAGTEIRRPRRAIVVVVDGLGYKEGQHLRAAQLLRERGQCRITDVGSLPMSRPVYGVISTGVEQDRGGALINDSTAPHAAESIWQIAREAGMSVAAVTDLLWWQQLFPNTFDPYLTPPRNQDYFRLAPAADLLLIHPLYVDETGHESGADSDEYRAAVQRVDEELLAYLKTIDLSRDLLVLTADHGHSLHGGHGGRQDRVAHVLTCLAGPGVQHRSDAGPLRTTAIAPTLSLLLGLRFPGSMQAGDDDLDALWEIADPAAFPAGYLAARRQSIERFRAENRMQLDRWLPSCHGSWPVFYSAARRNQLERAAPFAVLVLLILFLHRYGHRWLRLTRSPRRATLFGLLWLAGCGAWTYLLQAGLRGSFDMSSIDNRFGFIRFTLSLGCVVGLTGVIMHLLLRRCLRTVVWDMTILSLLGTVLCLAHPVVFGWRPGFPVPPPPLYFFPFFAALFLSTFNAVGILLYLFAGLSRRWPSVTVWLVSRCHDDE